MSTLKVDLFKVYTLGLEPLLLLGPLWTCCVVMLFSPTCSPAGISMINSNLCTFKFILIFRKQVHVMILQDVSVFLV